MILLDDDVLLLIFSYIHGGDALNVALASKRFHGLAIPAVSHEASCWELGMVRQLCDYMLTHLNSQPRARHLRVLVFLPTAFWNLGKKAKDSGTISLYGAKSLVADVLGEARGLRVLRWTDNFQYFFSSDPGRFTDVIESWKPLTVLELNMVDDDIISTLRSVTTLTVLTLRGLKAPEPGQEHRGMPTLLKTLAKLHRLHTLILDQFCSPDTSFEVADGSRPVARFPSITDLSLSGCSKSYLLLVQQCPSLYKLTVTHTAYPRPSQTLLPPEPLSPRWPALQTLAISTRDLPLCGLYRLNNVRELQLMDAPFEDSFMPIILPLALSVLSPLSISIMTSFKVDNSPSWDALAESQPGVRVLDIVVNPQMQRPWSNVWHDNIPRALCCLPLMSLRLIVCSPSPSETRFAAFDEPTRMQTTYRRLAAIPTLSISTLPGKIFDAVSTLRVLAIAEEVERVDRREMAAGGASTTPRALRLYMEDRTEVLPGQERHLEWGTLDRAQFRLHWWYRASPREDPMPIPEKEGEREYAAILSACTTATGSLAATADSTEQFLASMSLE